MGSGAGCGSTTGGCVTDGVPVVPWAAFSGVAWPHHWQEAAPSISLAPHFGQFMVPRGPVILGVTMLNAESYW